MTSKKIKREPSKGHEKEVYEDYLLILHNDDVHSFDYVIEAFVELCEHSYEQAVQCTHIAHHKGSCDIRKGELKKLKPIKDALSERELITTIELQP